MKRGVVKCLHDRAREIISTQDNLQKEVDHLAKVLKQNGYLANFICNASAPPTQETADTSSRDEEQEEERGPLVVIPYVTGMSEDIRRVCREFNIRVVFKYGGTLRSMLTKVKDTLPLGKQSNVVYRIPCSCGQVYIGETRQRLETRLKEHRDACERGMMKKSAVAEHAWENHHPIHWKETTAGPWQRTGAVGEGGPAHPDDTLRGALQPRWRTGSPWSLDRCDEEAGAILTEVFIYQFCI